MFLRIIIRIILSFKQCLGVCWHHLVFLFHKGTSLRHNSLKFDFFLILHFPWFLWCSLNFYLFYKNGWVRKSQAVQIRAGEQIFLIRLHAKYFFNFFKDLDIAEFLKSFSRSFPIFARTKFILQYFCDTKLSPPPPIFFSILNLNPNLNLILNLNR